jgi:lysozyme
MHLTEEGLNLIKKHEGWRAKAYKDPVGVWTIGYGHTSRAGAPKVKAGMQITEEYGEEILKNDIKTFENIIKSLVFVPLNPNQYSALVSFTYNVGGGNLKRSTLLRLLNAKRYKEAADQFPRWNKAGGKTLRGLTRRRLIERGLFLKPYEEEWVMIDTSTHKWSCKCFAYLIDKFLQWIERRKK